MIVLTGTTRSTGLGCRHLQGTETLFVMCRRRLISLKPSGRKDWKVIGRQKLAAIPRPPFVMLKHPCRIALRFE